MTENQLSEMKNMKNILFAFTALIALLTTLTTTSCNDPSQLGADLFLGDTLNIKFTDTLSINAVTEPTDSQLEYVSSSASYYSTHFVGKVDDPIFGTTEARMYTGLKLSSTYPDFSKIDTFSAYLELEYNAIRVYGDTLTTQKFSVYRLADTIPNVDIYSNKRLSTQGTPIGTYSFMPQPNINDVIYRTGKDTSGKDKIDTIVSTPRLRIPINKQFAQQIVALDSLSLVNFNTWFKGIEVRADDVSKCLLNFKTSGTSGLYFYYTNKGDTTRNTYVFTPSSSIQFTNVSLGHQSAPIKSFLNNQTKGDSLLFLQGMAGPDIKFEFPTLKNLGNVIINKAELELTVSADGTDIETYPAIDQLHLRTAQKVAIKDLTLDAAYTSTSPSYETLTTAGGFLRSASDGTAGVKKYYINLSSHLQLMLNGKEGTILYLSPRFKDQKLSRSVIYGPKHSKYRAKLNITYTKI